MSLRIPHDRHTRKAILSVYWKIRKLLKRLNDASTMKGKMTSKLQPISTLIDPRKCKIHRSWMKKGVCDLCRMAEQKALAEYKKKQGIVDVPIKVIKL